MSASLIPAEGTSSTTLWEAKPYAFGAWFTYAFHKGATIKPLMGIKTIDGKMCATLAGTQIDAGGGAIGFQVCAAPSYPDVNMEWAWFPLNCMENPAEACILSAKVVPYKNCGGTIRGIRFVGTGKIDKVEFKGPNDSNLGPKNTHAEVVPVDGYAAAPAGKGGEITAIHIKSFHDGEICLESMMLEY